MCELECELRLQALELAIELAGHINIYTEDVIDAAKKFYDFLKCSECEPKPESEIN